LVVLDNHLIRGEAVEERSFQLSTRSRFAGDLRVGEEMLWSGKPEAIPFIVRGYVGSALFGLLFFWSWSQSLCDLLTQLVDQPLDLILGMIPFSAGLGFLLFLLIRDFMRYRNTEYMITNQRLIVHVGSSKTSLTELENIQKVYVKEGTVFVRISGNNPTFHALLSLKEPNEVQKVLQEAVGKIWQRNQSIRHCPSCGAQIDEYAYFCRMCGAYTVDG
jgi:hypothetical protein